MNSLTIKILLGISFLCTLNLQAQSDHSKLDKYFEKKMKSAGRIGMQAAYIANGELIWVGSYGIKTDQKEDLINDSTLFMVASISKPVTALALMKLYDEGRVSLDADINDLLPFEVVNPYFLEEKITVRMLLTHLSSIRDNWKILEPLYTLGKGGGDSPMSLEEFLRAYLVEGGQFYDSANNFYHIQPLEEEHYSNVGYALIGYLVEVISGKPFNEYMAEEIFEPLNMDNTYWFLSEVPDSNIATPHNLPYKETDFKGTQVLDHFGYPSYPSGQLRTTVSDYAQFVKLMVNRGMVDDFQFLKEETVEEFLKVQYPDIAKWRAISWSMNEFENPIYNMIMPRRPSHTGLDPGMNSVVSFDPETRSGVIIFSNSPTTTFRTEKIIYLDMVKRLFKEAKLNSKQK
ncbi:serine hydrolase domain-containing protein [Algoriphagus halophilus]|uniref:CubicO group peptidase, beta-lactamase class C family n=1 Tax=Algoriphagus halophilus TaxID=226505 RepID=A0A1N6G942_9BACT|nr:serine hydrolase [Algoriphagus halophilus]SIO04053.1 CubicO group peptidase, beta-lactamase class C family [Algoriphagus halophilus]